MNAAPNTSTRRDSSLLDSLRSLPGTAWILFLGVFLNKFGTFVIPFLTLYLTRQGYSVAQAGLAVGAYGVGHLAASITGGWMADKVGRRRTIVFSMFAGAASMLLLSQARSFPMILMVTVLTGLTGELYRPASSALLADLIQPGQRVTAYSAYRLAFNAGWAFGPATAGFLAERGFGWLFLGDAATSMLFGAVAWSALPRIPVETTAASNSVHSNDSLLRNRRLLWLLFAAFLVSTLFFQIGSTLGLYTAQVGISAIAYGFILSLNGAMVATCELPITTQTRRFQARTAIATGYALAGVGIGLIALAHTVPLLLVCMTILTLGEMVAMPVCSAYIADLAPPQQRGRYLGAYAMTWSAGMMFGPAVGLQLFKIHPALTWITFGTLGFVASGMVAVALKSRTPAPSPTQSAHNQKPGFRQGVGGR